MVRSLDCRLGLATLLAHRFRDDGSVAVNDEKGYDPKWYDREETFIFALAAVLGVVGTVIYFFL